MYRGAQTCALPGESGGTGRGGSGERIGKGREGRVGRHRRPRRPSASNMPRIPLGLFPRAFPSPPLREREQRTHPSAPLRPCTDGPAAPGSAAGRGDGRGGARRPRAGHPTRPCCEGSGDRGRWAQSPGGGSGGGGGGP